MSRRLLTVTKEIKVVLRYPLALPPPLLPLLLTTVNIPKHPTVSKSPKIMASFRMRWSSILLVLGIILVVMPSDVAAFGAGNIPSIAQVEGHNFRHGGGFIFKLCGEASYISDHTDRSIITRYRRCPEHYCLPQKQKMDFYADQTHLLWQLAQRLFPSR